MALFHHQIGFPANLDPPTGQVHLVYTWHAEQAAEFDRHGRLTPHLPTLLNLDTVQVVEVETTDLDTTRPTKMVVRYTLGCGLDLVMVLRPVRGDLWKVITVWGNRSSDRHSTLHRGAYTTVA